MPETQPNPAVISQGPVKILAQSHGKSDKTDKTENLQGAGFIHFSIYTASQEYPAILLRFERCIRLNKVLYHRVFIKQKCLDECEAKDQHIVSVFVTRKS